jgi:hypothetical protein
VRAIQNFRKVFFQLVSHGWIEHNDLSRKKLPLQFSKDLDFHICIIKGVNFA